MISGAVAGGKGEIQGQLPPLNFVMSENCLLVPKFSSTKAKFGAEKNHWRKIKNQKKLSTRIILCLNL